MKKGDLDYKIMESLDVRIGNVLPILQYRSNLLQNIDELNPDFQDITSSQKVFSEAYKTIWDRYSKIQKLDKNVKEQHGRSIVECFWQKLLELESPKKILEDSVKNKDARKIKEVAKNIYGSVEKLSSLVTNFGNLCLYREYRNIKN